MNIERKQLLRLKKNRKLFKSHQEYKAYVQELTASFFK